MNREELELAVLASMPEGKFDAKDLIVAAYNRAIDDAKLELEKDQFSVYDEVMLNELKIRD